MPKTAPGPSRAELLASWRRFHVDPLGSLVAMWRTHGDVIRVPLVKDHFLIADPAALRHVLKDHRKNYDKAQSMTELRHLVGGGLLTAPNEAWVAQRRQLARAFTTRAVQADVARVCAAAADLAASWDAALGDARAMTRLVSADFARLTMRLSMSALLGDDASADARQLGDAFERAQTALLARMRSVAKVPLALPTAANRELKGSVAAFDHLLERARSSSACPAAGFLARLGSLGDEINVRDEAVTILLGYESTSNALSWTVHLLSLHREEQERVRAEIRDGCGRGPLDLERLGRLPILDRVIAESLRLFPPVPVMLRDVIADDVIADYRIPAGSVVACLPYLAHRHPRYWDEPEAFRPDRFLGTDDLPAYLPFGMVPRGCIGERMSQLWMKTSLATLLRQFEFHADPTFTVEQEAVLTLAPRHGLRVRIARADEVAVHDELVRAS